MNKLEVGKLLTIASGFDRRVVDALTTEAWFSVPEVKAADFGQAQSILIAHQTGPQAAEYFTVRHLAAGLAVTGRTALADVEADVRSAKGRGLIPSDWPKRQPLTADVAAKLTAARERDRREAERYGPAAIEE